MEDQQVLDFVVAMCVTGEAGRYGEQQHGSAAERFANEVAQQARERFGEGRDLLTRAKDRLGNFSREHIRRQLNLALGEGFTGQVVSNYQGIYRWTISFSLPGFVLPQEAESGEPPLRLKFGPSAWFANEQDLHWKVKIDPKNADYSRLFITWEATREIRQSVVTVQEVLDGLSADDMRLRDEILSLIQPTVV